MLVTMCNAVSHRIMQRLIIFSLCFLERVGLVQYFNQNDIISLSLSLSLYIYIYIYVIVHRKGTIWAKCASFYFIHRNCALLHYKICDKGLIFILDIIIELWLKNILPVYFLVDRKCNKTNLISFTCACVLPMSLWCTNTTCHYSSFLFTRLIVSHFIVRSMRNN